MAGAYLCSHDRALASPACPLSHSLAPPCRPPEYPTPDTSSAGLVPEHRMLHPSHFLVGLLSRLCKPGCSGHTANIPTHTVKASWRSTVPPSSVSSSNHPPPVPHMSKAANRLANTLASLLCPPLLHTHLPSIQTTVASPILHTSPTGVVRSILPHHCRPPPFKHILFFT